ncbi:MAG: transglutaminase-like domain-containing protein [Candidatus Portnoybacteria bacterium]|nr:transglutaminase-like domain-containing protein [Candidatus Portnoybacteria bacterium]
MKASFQKGLILIRYIFPNLFMNEFLTETKYCDFNNSKVKELATKITENAKTDQEKAVALFYWVRDNILYRVGFWNRKASETLLDGKGVCTCKANLLIALLRAIGIPAGYGVMRVVGREYFGPIVPICLKNLASKESIHVYVFVFLDNRWIKCDPSDDKSLSAKIHHLNPQSRIIEWDGETDAMLNLDPSHVLKNEGPLSNLDHIMCKKPRTATKNIVNFGNLYIHFLRKNSIEYTGVDQFWSSFMCWIRKNHFKNYLLFQIAASWQGLKAKLHLTKY